MTNTARKTAPMTVITLALILAGTLPSLPGANQDDSDAAERPSTEVNAALLEQKDKNYDDLRVDPDFSPREYGSIHISPSEVSFRKHWQRDQNRYDKRRVTDKDAERILEDVRTMLDESMRDAFNQAGYALTDTPETADLIVSPAIVELDIAAPDTPSARRTFNYTDSVGAMTMQLTMTDRNTGAPQLELSVRKRDPMRGFLEWRTRSNNSAIARRMMRSWADQVLTTLDEAAWSDAGE